MQKKAITLVILGMLVTSGFGVFGSQTQIFSEEKTLNLPTIELEQPVIIDKVEYASIELNGVSTNLMEPGRPMVPKIIDKIELPFGVRNIQVEIIPKHIKQYTISKEIIPAPVPVSLSLNNAQIDDPITSKPARDVTVYDNNDFFPYDWSTYTVGCGLNENMKRVTHLTIHTYPVRYNPVQGIVKAAESIDITISYELPEIDLTNANDQFDMVVITPSEFSNELQRLIDHKNDIGIKTILKTTEEIYSEFSGVDKPEEIKYFIKDAIESWNITYVLLVGGLTSTLYAKARDNKNEGTSGWHLPVRYSNLNAGEPGYVVDLYYADIYKEGGEFDDWDSNDDGIFAKWSGFGRDILDMYPDVALGRLACRNIDEVITLVDKIITYEETPANPSWFKKIIGVSGDGFLDQDPLDIQWDTSSLPDGKYTIYAQSNNDEGEFGPIDQVEITLAKSSETVLTFNHDDHLQIDNFPNYPHLPIAEIVTVSNGDVLGSTDFSYNPPEDVAYTNYGWANMKYANEVLTIGGKTYDPKLYGNITDIHVWIENSNGEQVFESWRNGMKCFSEGDWTVGEMTHLGRSGSFHYMPEDYEKVFLSSSNGEWTGMEDVMNAISEGSGFLFFSGHGSPNSWGNHYPGVPGNRHNADVEGLKVSQIKMFPPFYSGTPLFPIDELSNGEKLPIAVVGGCHNSMINVSGIPSLLHIFWYMGLIKNNWMHTYGNFCPETFSWRIVRNPDGGAIASIGNTGYGYGTLGEYCIVGGLDNWITTEFFRQYGVEGLDVLGDAYSQTLNAYLDEFGVRDDAHVKSVQQWILLGDPSLKIGG